MDGSNLAVVLQNCFNHQVNRLGIGIRTAVKNRITSSAGVAYTCVMHFNPYRNLFGTVRPDYYAAITDAYIVYPWEINRGPESVLLREF